MCHGNICRSPMAEFVMKDLVRKAGRDGEFYIESAATSTEEIGNEVYPPAKRKLAEHGISCKGKTARQMTRRDYDRFDLLIGMDAANIRNMYRICGGDPEQTIHQLLDFTDMIGDVAFISVSGNQEASVVVTDMQGKVLTSGVRVAPGMNQIPLNLSNGKYMLMVKQGKNHWVRGIRVAQ